MVVVPAVAVVQHHAAIERVLHLHHAPRERVLRPEAEDADNLVEVDVVVPLVHDQVVDDDLGVRDERLDDLAHLAQFVVLLLRADIEGLPRDFLDRRFEREDQRAGDVIDVDEGAPLVAAVDRDPPLRDRLRRHPAARGARAPPRSSCSRRARPG